MTERSPKNTESTKSAPENGTQNVRENLFVQIEHDVLDFWEREKCFELLRKKVAGREPFLFIDGPITANNPMGIHHAWGRSLKDIFIRYKTRRGFDGRFQNGFDSQGLWVEVEVEKELGFASKKDIEAYGLDKFTAACKARVRHYADVITGQSKRLGQWMDWDNSYFTNTDENIQGIWYFLKKCHENGWLRLEHRPMPWCPRCGTSLSEHEMTGSYKIMTHNSVFFKLPLSDGRKILVWTTTPWTLSSNVALAVNSEQEYAEVRVKSDDAVLVLGKNAIKILDDDKLEILRIFKGEELVGLSYETCFPELPSLVAAEHKVVAWDEVDALEGVGVVHIAPGCGAEDFALGQSLGLPNVMPVDDSGIFLEGFGFFSGKDSHTIAPEVFEELEKRGKLYKVEPHKHSYPVCWRCKHEVIFRLVPAWYLATKKLKPRLIRAAESVKWEPESGLKRMLDWLNNMGDWNISRKRFYGLPLPFYPCECGELTVVGSRADLEELAEFDSAQLPELHRPWIDAIEIKCPKCGKPVKRVAETGDVWLDAGIVPFSTLGYFSDKEYWQKHFPADWITEMREQIRLWFYSMLFMSVVLEDCAPYKRVLAYSSVVKEDGGKFSKSDKTTFINFNNAAEIIGADTIRYLYASGTYSSDVRFGYALGDEARRKLLSFWNIFTFFQTYAEIDKPQLDGYYPDIAALISTDRWLLLRTNQYIAEATAAMEDFKTNLLVRAFEQFVDDVSNWYVRSNRRRFWKSGDDTDKRNAYATLYFAIDAMLRTMAPIIPFLTEHIWQNLTRRLFTKPEVSIHLSDWAEPLPDIRDDGILGRTALAREIIAAALKLRNEQQIKVRQPLGILYICGMADVDGFEKQILDELNVKALKILPDFAALICEQLGVNFKAAGAALKGEANCLKAALVEAGADEMARMATEYASGTVTVSGFAEPLDASLFTLSHITKPGIAAAEVSEGLTLALDTTLTEDLKKEGAVRDILRQFQVLRKESGLRVEQRVHAAARTESAFLLEALAERKTEIAAELLADSLNLGEMIPGASSKVIALPEGEITLEVLGL
ncbi:MAG: isoleucine--tRNA ligase [Oscillospiraceae bacterium]|jgi:isoleucyl-tRNA synthetase|nr:isoleucine--tRNA ligase [Oscillospiraceae bacterium]